MHRIVQEISNKWTSISSRKVFVAASGGLDSSCLIYIMKSLNFDVEVLHVNYNLRGEDSILDAKYLETFCASLDVKFSRKEIDLKEQLSNGGNLQQLARDVRYNWFEEVLQKNENALIALGHHKDDQVETFFLNLARKSGVLGMAAMLEKNGNYIRPFLSFTKKELESFAKENNITWREDISNQSNKYRRNFLRNALIPIMENEVSTLTESVICLVSQFQKSQAELEEVVTTLVIKSKKNASLLIEDYLSLTELEKNEFIRQLGQVPHKQEELSSLASAENNKRVELKLNKNCNFEAIVKNNETYFFTSNSSLQNLPVLIQEAITELPTVFSKDVIYLDKASVQGILKLRFPENGDRIKSIGLKGSQLISDIIKDAKLSFEDKKKVVVLTDDNEIHWCVGLKVGRTAVASKGSQKIIKLSIV